MKNNFLTKNLNDKQKEIITSSYKNILVLAGAGSGKTKVLTNKIAWLIDVKKYHSSSIMAVTFTNKGAKEIINRMKFLIKNLKDIWIGTFHGLSYKLLCMHYTESKLFKNFQIIDSEDQLKLIHQINLSMKLNFNNKSYHNILEYIRNYKDKGIRPSFCEININNKKNILYNKIYKEYQTTCDKLGLLDFSELLLRINELFINNKSISKFYKKKFKYILVDEFQDTNDIQYSWIKNFSSKECFIMIVGDDDQSIYGWRGAKSENMKNFINDFSRTKIIKLQQNYRSTNNILQAANSLIMNNNLRIGKKLWTEKKSGDLITIYQAYNEKDESNFIIKYILNNQKKLNNKKKEYAILYRKNSQSRSLEENLLKNNLKYDIYGGLKFFSRQEIKNTLAYFRLIVNKKDDLSYERIINFPKRKIGEKTLKKIKNISKNKKLSLWESTNFFIKNNLNDAKSFSLKNFFYLIDYLKENIKNLSLHEKFNFVIKKSGLLNFYEKEKKNINNSRIDNWQELVNSAKQFFIENNKEKNILEKFLAFSTLESERYTSYDDENYKIKLMTLHSSKGLEFPIVFIIGMEEGLFPNIIYSNNKEKLEEERRLAYVGMTRAMKKLVITYVKYRNIYGKIIKREPSRFIEEIPSHYKKIIYENKTNTSKNEIKKDNYYYTTNNTKNNYEIGKKVFHPKFGFGLIIHIEKNKILEIKFKKIGIKKLVAKYARLELC
ncbi:uvrD [Wigglesworthia glossinidia endosymbiont of Glossina brevipalpis]|uniref:DNA 3'-5' helicase n=1 Tax=Wigglesworthia glossinidia brevipalpis TaxID=36870 RepID=Q8D2T2_WIGBR|nr:uvrD [Wigglesworthia glossinidia endosymbiont of Glossina brevipalpis]